MQPKRDWGSKNNFVVEYRQANEGGGGTVEKIEYFYAMMKKYDNLFFLSIFKIVYIFKYLQPLVIQIIAQHCEFYHWECKNYWSLKF